VIGLVIRFGLIIGLGVILGLSLRLILWLGGEAYDIKSIL
jgi:hypothetical protein